MALDLKLELFAHDLFCKIFFENKVRDKICDSRVHYADEFMRDVEDHQKQIYEDCFYHAVVCKQYFLRNTFFNVFEKGLRFYTSSYSDFCDYVNITFNRLDLFGHLDLYDRMFATCAYLADLCLFCHAQGHPNFIKIAHLCWALYFDKFSYLFYETGGWRKFREVALCYSVPFQFLTTHVEPMMTRSYMSVSLTTLHLALKSFEFFLFSGIDKNKTVSRNWIEYHRKSGDVFQNILRRYGHMDKVQHNAFVAESNLQHLTRLCHPFIKVFRDMEEKVELHSSENTNYSFATEEYDGYLSGDELKSLSLHLEDKEESLISESNEERYPKIPESQEDFQQHSEKYPFLQQSFEAENLRKFSESNEILQLHSKQENGFEKTYEQKNNCQNEGLQQLPEHEINPQEHSGLEKILERLSEDIKRLPEQQFSENENSPLPEFQTNSPPDQDKVSFTSANHENILKICQENISTVVESCDIPYLKATDQKPSSNSNEHQQSNAQNVEIHKIYSQLFQIQKGNSPPKQVEKNFDMRIPEGVFTLTEHQMKNSLFHACEKRTFSSDNNVKSSLSKNQKMVSPCDAQTTEHPITENQNNETSQRTFHAEVEHSFSTKLIKLSPFDQFLISGNSNMEYQNISSPADIETNGSTILKRCKRTYELLEKNSLYKFPTKYEIYNTLFLPDRNPCINNDEIGLNSSSDEETPFSPTDISADEAKENFQLKVLREVFEYERDLLRVVCEGREYSLKKDKSLANELMYSNISTDRNEDLQREENDEVLLQNMEDRKNVANINRDQENFCLLSKQSNQILTEIKEIKSRTNLVKDKECASVVDTELIDLLRVCEHREYSLKKDNTTILANIISQTNCSPPIEDQKNEIISSNISTDQNKDPQSAENDEVPLQKMEDRKIVVPIKSDQENFCLLSKKSDQALAEIKEIKNRTSFVEDNKSASVVDDIDDFMMFYEDLKGEELVRNPEQPTQKAKKRKKCKKRKFNKKHGDENDSPALVPQTGSVASEGKLKHSTKRSQSKELTPAKAHRDFPQILTATDISSKISDQIAALSSVVQKATFPTVMNNDIAVESTCIKMKYKEVEKDISPARNKTSISSKLSDQITAALCSIINKLTLPMAVERETAVRPTNIKGDQKEDISCAEIQIEIPSEISDHIATASRSNVQNLTLPTVVDSETGVKKTGIKTNYKVVEKGDLSSPEIQTTNIPSKISDQITVLCFNVQELTLPIVVDSETSVKQTGIKTNYKEIEKRDISSPEIQTTNIPSKISDQITVLCSNVQELTLPIVVDSETSVKQTGIKTNYKGVEKGDISGIDKVSSIATKFDETSFILSKNHKGDLLSSVYVEGKVESDLATEVGTFGSSSDENSVITDMKELPALNHVESSHPSCFSKPVETYSGNKTQKSVDSTISSATSEQYQNTSCVPSNTPSTISGKGLHSQIPLFVPASQRDIHNNLKNCLDPVKGLNIDANEKDRLLNRSDINCAYAEEPSSKEIALNSNVQFINNEPLCSNISETLENDNESDACVIFPRTQMKSSKEEQNSSNRDTILQSVDEKIFLINNILTLGVENKRFYLTSLLKKMPSSKER